MLHWCSFCVKCDKLVRWASSCRCVCVCVLLSFQLKQIYRIHYSVSPVKQVRRRKSRIFCFLFDGVCVSAGVFQGWRVRGQWWHCNMKPCVCVCVFPQVWRWRLSALHERPSGHGVPLWECRVQLPLRLRESCPRGASGAIRTRRRDRATGQRFCAAAARLWVQRLDQTGLRQYRVRKRQPVWSVTSSQLLWDQCLLGIFSTWATMTLKLLMDPNFGKWKYDFQGQNDGLKPWLINDTFWLCQFLLCNLIYFLNIN